MKRTAKLEITTGEEQLFNKGWEYYQDHQYTPPGLDPADGDIYLSLEARINGKTALERHYKNQSFGELGLGNSNTPLNEGSRELKARLEQLERENKPASYSLKTAEGKLEARELNNYLHKHLHRLGIKRVEA